MPSTMPGIPPTTSGSPSAVNVAVGIARAIIVSYP
jgi:hypothetical protein